MIKIGRSSDPGAIYIGRGSPLGNPFKMENQSMRERDRVIERYRVWLLDRLVYGYEPQWSEFNRIMDLARTQDVILGCFCSPLRCHGDIVKAIIEDLIECQDGGRNWWETYKEKRDV